ncbi:hypothetical protein [Granulicella sp. S190]|uniref:hypothetical protein n=1 Tax=Granulicella sp. S190 TaxID=1747226 RepID=UPI00131EA0A6|nr:hypothetical protein [Granulicella sp. S190]
MTNRSLFTKSLRAQILCGLLIALATSVLSSCHSDNFLAYKFPQFPFANRPVPPSLLANRVMVGITANGGTSGNLEILDALRDIRSNIENTKMSFSISGFSSGYPSMILSFPSEIVGYVYSNTNGDVQIINYGKESDTGSAGTFPGATSIAIPPTFGHFYAALGSSGLLEVVDNTTGKSYGMNVPNVFQVVVNQGDSVVLAMVRNSNTVYRLIKLNANQYVTATAAIAAIGAVDCEPLNLPIYCVVPVNTGSTTTAFDRPVGAYFSLDGNTVYVLNCGAECGGTASSVTNLLPGALLVNSYINSTDPAQQNPNSYSSTTPVPGGVTTAVADTTTLYVAGQQQQPDGLFAGNLSTINLASNTVTSVTSISDGTHNKILLADDNTLWIGSHLCATGERAARAAQQLAAGQVTDQTANYNCLTRVALPSGSTPISASIVPAVTQVPKGSTTSPVIVPFPNTNQNEAYYGDLTGLCWVQGLHKMYTAYGGQIHAFNTADGSEINNVNIIVQGTALDVAYMDAVTDAAN